MSTVIVQAEYDLLEEIIGRFEGCADDTNGVLRSLSSVMEQLKGGGWLGEAAVSFYREMEDEIFPTLELLESAFVDSGDFTQNTIQRFQEAEDEAANNFNLLESGGRPGGASGGAKPHVPPRRPGGRRPKLNNPGTTSGVGGRGVGIDFPITMIQGDSLPSSPGYVPRRSTTNTSIYSSEPTNANVSNVRATPNSRFDRFVSGAGGWLKENKEEIAAAAIGIGVTAAIIATAPASVPALAVAGVAGAVGAGASSLFYNKAEHDIAVGETLQTRDFWVDTAIGGVSGVVGGAVAKHGVSAIMSRAGIGMPSFISSNGRFLGTEWAKGVAARYGANGLRATQIGLTMGAEGTTEGVLSGGEQVLRNTIDGNADTQWHDGVAGAAGSGFVTGAVTGGVIDMRVNRSIDVDGNLVGNNVNDVIHRQGFMSDAELDMHASILHDPIVQDLGITSIQVEGGRMETPAGLYNRNYIEPNTRPPLPGQTTYPRNPSIEDHFMPEFRARAPKDRYIKLPDGTYREATRAEIDNTINNLIATKPHKEFNLPGLGYDELDAFFGYVDDSGTTRMLTPQDLYDNAVAKGYDVQAKWTTDASGNNVVQSVRIPALEEAIAGPDGIYTTYYRDHPLTPEIHPGESMTDMLRRTSGDPNAEWELDDWSSIPTYSDPTTLDSWSGIRVGYDDAGNVVSHRPQLAPWQREIPGGHRAFEEARANGTLDELNAQMGPYDNYDATMRDIEEYNAQMRSQQDQNPSSDQ